MIVSIKKGTDEAQIQNLVEWLESLNLEIHRSNGVYDTILGLVGDTSRVDMDLISGLIELLKEGTDSKKQAK